ncbi:MAG: hypothetical protein SFT94_05790 [Pseudanabaenaceae cyanobacterium bins.68]|nr:hypothetical protein [Pseudanabaenaceae cyanobacterium bins.68]
MTLAELESTAHPLALYRNHLEFNGYKVEETDERIFCRHSRKSNLILRDLPNRGVLVTTIYALKPEVDRLDLLEYVNHMNSEFFFLKGYAADVSGLSLVLETFYEGEYNRQNFNLLLENIEIDILRLFDNQSTEQFLS